MVQCKTITQPANVFLATGVLPSICKQSNNMAVRLYTGNGSNVSDDSAILSDKNCN